MGKARRIASIVRGHADGICYAPRVHFGVWHPIGDAGIVAPEGSGVLQARAEGVMDYETGRSAMVFYACSRPGETLRGYVGGRGARQLRRAVAAGARWIRFAEAPEPGDELDRLIKGFVERFGSPPINNAGPAATRRRADEE
jgi:hypothetical protein